MIEVILSVIEFILGGICVIMCVLLIIGWYAFLYSIRYKQMEDE